MSTFRRRRSLTPWLTCLLGACAGAGPASPPTPPAVRPGPVTAPPPARQPDARATPGECTALLGHLIDLELAAPRADGVAPSASERAQLEATMREPFHAECVALPAAAVQCGLRATTRVDAERCDR